MLWIFWWAILPNPSHPLFPQLIPPLPPTGSWSSHVAAELRDGAFPKVGEVWKSLELLDETVGGNVSILRGKKLERNRIGVGMSLAL